MTEAQSAIEEIQSNNLVNEQLISEPEAQDDELDLQNEDELDEYSDEEDDGEESEDDKESGTPSYQKKLFRRQERRLKKENKNLRHRLTQLEMSMQAMAGALQPQQTVGVAQLQPQQQITANVDPELSKLENWYNQKREQETQEARRREAERHNSEIESNFIQKMEAAYEKYDDFRETVHANDVPFTPVMISAVKFVPNSAEVLYSLAKNKSEVQRISKLPPQFQAKAIYEHAIEVAKNQPRKTSKAPPALKKISQGEGKAPAKSPASMTYEEIKKRNRDARMKQRETRNARR